jgi:cytochrome c biogenesis protein CcdA
MQETPLMTPKLPTAQRYQTLFTGVLVGLLSFLSPCVLPLVPAYIGYLSRQAFGTARVIR